MQAEEFDLSTIQEESVRHLVVDLMNQVEKLSAQVGELQAENQRLRDEVNRLKGEQGKPKIAANIKAKPDLSSEKERHQSKPHQKSSKQAHIHIDREEVLKVDQETIPADSIFKGYEEVVVQDISFRTRNTRFRKEKYYSPSHHKTYLAPLPAGYQGQFGPGIRAWVLTLYHEGGMSEPKIVEILQTVGISISAGEISDLLIHDQDLFHGERAAVVEAGLSSSPWQHLDSTATRVGGQNRQCHVLCNQLYTFYCTTACKDRRSYLRVLLGGADPCFRFNELALVLLGEMKVSPKWSDQLSMLLPQEQDLTEEELDLLLDAGLPRLGPEVRKNIKDALAIAAYRTQTSYPVVDLLVCDDAPQFNWLTLELALCWIHEFRHYKKLIPRFAHHLLLLQEFGLAFWKLYHALLAYRSHPSPALAATLSAQFDDLFTTKSGYDQLDERKQRTLGKRDQLLMVLTHPEILLHNNPAELGARQRVRRRDVSLQARTSDGIAAWDTFQTLVETAKKLGVNIYHYLYDRITRANLLPSLATLIGERAQLMALGASWQLGP